MASVGANAVLKVTMDSKDFDQGMHRAQKRTKDFEDQTKKAQGQLRLMRGGLGQLGHQVQDVAVQLQSGQNAMLVFGQQGSQIASLMGPNGALIGAVLAVGAALATYFMPKLFDASEALKDVEDSVGEMIDRFDTLQGASKLEALQQAKDRFEALDKVIADNEEEIADLTKRINDNGVAWTYDAEQIAEFNREILYAKAVIQEAGRQKEILTRKVDDTTDAFEEFNEKLDEQIISLTQGEQALESYKISISDMSDAEKLAARIRLDAYYETKRIQEQQKKDQKAAEQAFFKNIQRETQAEQSQIKKQQQERERIKKKQEADAKAQLARFESLRGERTLEIASIGKTAEQIERLKLIHEGYSEQQLQELDRLRQLKEAREQAYQAQVEQEAEDMGLSGAFTKVKDEFADMDSSMQQAMLSNVSTVMGSVSQTMGAVGQLFKEGSSEAKAFMVISKGLEASNAIIAGLSGAVSIKAAYAKMALANPAMAGAYEAMGTASAAMMKTMGFVNAGMIMGQAVASFDGGGFTGHGARVAGLDGKGGFPAILHPNESIIDHTKGQSMATNVTINIQANDTKGFDELLRSRRGEIIGIVNKAINNRGVSSLI